MPLLTSITVISSGLAFAEIGKTRQTVSGLKSEFPFPTSRWLVRPRVVSNFSFNKSIIFSNFLPVQILPEQQSPLLE